MSGETIDSIETTFVAKTGRLIEVEGDVTVQYAGDKVVTTRGIFRDITERKGMEEALAAERERLAITLRSIGDGVITTDAPLRRCWQVPIKD